MTCNYAAREQGVTKLMSTAEARRRCPSLALVRRGTQGTPARLRTAAAAAGGRAGAWPPAPGLLLAPQNPQPPGHCPLLTLCCSGEDLTPYREASKAVLAVLRRYGTCEKLGLDEAFVDATALVSWRDRRLP